MVSGVYCIVCAMYTADIYIYPSKLNYILLIIQCSIVDTTELYTLSSLTVIRHSPPILIVIV